MPRLRLSIRRPVLVLGLAAAALVVAALTAGAPPARAQLFPTTTEAPTTTTTVPATSTTAPTTSTSAPPTTAPPATRPPTTRVPSTTAAPTTAAPTTAPPTTAPPGPPVPAPTTTAVVAPEPATVTQDTPDLGGVLAVWALSILAVVGIMATTWWRNRQAEPT